MRIAQVADALARIATSDAVNGERQGGQGQE